MHSIDKVTASPLKPAPPFRELHSRYPHPNMPEFRLDPGQVGDLISYLKWLDVPKTNGPPVRRPAIFNPAVLRPR